MRKKILYVEDNEAERRSLKELLCLHGFDVEVAAGVAEARTIEQRLGDAISVVVLDMELGEATTGAHVGIEIKNRRPASPPEFAIRTAFRTPDYLELSLRLGAAAYLVKSRDDGQRVVRVVRALALRHALDAWRREVSGAFAIADGAPSRLDAAEGFCRRVLYEILATLLGVTFILLLTSDGRTHVIGDAHASGPKEAYEKLQAFTYGDTGRVEPFVLDAPRFRKHVSDAEQEIFDRWNGAAFIPLTAGPDLRLSLGLLPPSKAERRPPEDVEDLARTLAQYLRPTIMESLLQTISAWTNVDARRQAMVVATSQFCIYAVNDLRAMLDEAVQEEEVILGGPKVARLLDFADELRSTGVLLGSMEQRSNGPSARSAPPSKPTSLADAAARAWTDLAPLVGAEQGLVEIEGDCAVHADQATLERSIAGLLQWFAQRRVETPEGHPRTITVRCEETQDDASLTIEDRSRRLPDLLRRNLFLPFSGAVPPPGEGVRERARAEGHVRAVHLPLFAAKMLIELGANGVLEDRTGELAAPLGHRLVLRFPRKASERSGAGA